MAAHDWRRWAPPGSERRAHRTPGCPHRRADEESHADPDDARIPIKRALVSVYDKTGLDELARGLHDAGVELVSTGARPRRIADAGRPGHQVEELTGFPECLDGRVKTLHPQGARRHPRRPAPRVPRRSSSPSSASSRSTWSSPTSTRSPQTVASGATPDECVEQIDIGGPSMVRAAAKNHPSVAIVTSPDALRRRARRASRDGGFTLAQRQRLAAEAFAHTATYDVHVASWMGNVLTDTARGQRLPGLGRRDLGQGGGAALRREPAPARRALHRRLRARAGLAQAEQLHGKEMSYNNYVDADAARRAAYDFDEPAVAIIKHANPCGIAVGADVAEAHRKAHACDPVSAFGGVIAANRPVIGRDGRAGRRDLHRGRRRARLRGRRGRGAGRRRRTSGCWSCAPPAPRRRRVPPDHRRRC